MHGSLDFYALWTRNVSLFSFCIRSTTSHLVLECEEEELEPWQKQTSNVQLKDEDDVGELSMLHQVLNKYFAVKLHEHPTSVLLKYKELMIWNTWIIFKSIKGISQMEYSRLPACLCAFAITITSNVHLWRSLLVLVKCLILSFCLFVLAGNDQTDSKPNPSLQTDAVSTSPPELKTICLQPFFQQPHNVFIQIIVSKINDRSKKSFVKTLSCNVNLQWLLNGYYYCFLKYGSVFSIFSGLHCCICTVTMQYWIDWLSQDSVLFWKFICSHTR